MPSPKKKIGDLVFYRRKDGAWVKQGGTFVKVGKNRYKNKPHYSLHIKKLDAKRRARINRKLRKRYPQAYD